MFGLAYRAYVLAYDAARFICIALLAPQGLNVMTSGGQFPTEQAAIKCLDLALMSLDPT